MTAVEMIGYLGAAASIANASMKTMIPLRAIGILGNCIFIVFGLLAPVYPTLLLHSVLLPLNTFRLVQMLRLVRKVRDASQGDLSIEWLKPYMAVRRCAAGEVLFRAGDAAIGLIFIASGSFRLREIGLELGPGELVGELGLVAPGNRRTQTMVCLVAGEVMTVPYDAVRQLYFQNPEFGFWFLKLTSARLFRDLQRARDGLGVAAVAQSA